MTSSRYCLPCRLYLPAHGSHSKLDADWEKSVAAQTRNVGAGVLPVRASAARLGFVHTRAKSRLGFEESNQKACGALLRRTGEDTRPYVCNGNSYPCWLGTAAWSGETAIDSVLAFSSEISSPARMHAAPTPARPPSRSPRKMNDVIQANTGSRVKISAVWVAGVNCCAQA